MINATTSYTSFAVVSEALGGDAWRPNVRALSDVLAAVADLAAYGMIRRGTSVRSLSRECALEIVWIELPDIAGWSWRIGPAEADRQVPDAFGIQLLGRGHLGRFAGSSRWVVMPLPAGGALVEHVDLAAWFAAARPQPDVVRDARGDFAQLMGHE